MIILFSYDYIMLQCLFYYFYFSKIFVSICNPRKMMTHPQIQLLEKVMSDAIDHIPEIDCLEDAKRNILS